MYGGSRGKWTKILANFKSIEAMDVRCNRAHQHAPWGFAVNDEGQQVWATSLESRYPRKLCVVLTQLVLQVAEQHQLHLPAVDLTDDQDNPLKTSLHSQIGAHRQPKRLPPLVPDFASVATFLCEDVAMLPCALQSKLPSELQLHTKMGRLEMVPKSSRLLRISAFQPDLTDGGEGEAQDSKRQKADDGFAVTSSDMSGIKKFPYEVAFGLPWDWREFVDKACSSQHPFLQDAGVPQELGEAVDFHMELNDEQLCKYRKDWCKKWLKRAQELDKDERANRATRPKHVADMTVNKRVILTREILNDIGYQDVKCLELIEQGSSLAGEIENCDIFKSQYKPCLMNQEQLEKDSKRRNEYILRFTVSAGSDDLDRQLLEETREELDKGWAEGPFTLGELEEGATVSRRFPLIQGAKTRMIDDFSISGVNDSCSTFNKIDLHVVDTFSSLVKKYFKKSQGSSRSGVLEGKTYDLKSAYRQVPIKSEHLKFGYFSVYNMELGEVQIYRLRTLPFGATHNVYSFLRLARMLYWIAVKGLRLLTTNFYDDFILASPPSLKESARNSMELIFMLTGWEFARSGKKATEFGVVCRALGVQFDFTLSNDLVLLVGNTESRRSEILALIGEALKCGHLDKSGCLTLRGKLGFADSFMHGRLGAILLKKLSEHAYGRTSKFDEDVAQALTAMAKRLEVGEPRRVHVGSMEKWFIFTDASYEPEMQPGGLGGVLVDSSGCLVTWFGLELGPTSCLSLGGARKDTLIYELELLAAVLSLHLWCKSGESNIHVWFGDKDSVRYALIKASGSGSVAIAMLKFHLVDEAPRNSLVWFARVPTEANISDFPSRLVEHPFLPSTHCCNPIAKTALDKLLSVVTVDL